MSHHPSSHSRRRLVRGLGAALGLAGAGARAQARPLKVAVVMSGPLGQGGWSDSHEAARRAVEARFGARVQTQAVASVPDGPSAESTLRDLVAQGCRLIFATSFGYLEPALRVAADHPEVRFEHATGYKTAPNLATFDARSYESAYLAGLVAGGMTRSLRLGVVGALPTPEVVRVINAFVLGARAVQPAAGARVVWIDTWFDPPRETDAALTLVRQGVDVLLPTTDSPAVLRAADRAGVFAFGMATDMAAQAPRAHLGSAVFDWAPYYTQAVGALLEGRWAPGQTWWGVREGVVDLVSVPERVPAALRQRVDTARRELRAGRLDLWAAPLQDNTGRTMLAAGARADDAFLHRMQFYVSGIDGRVPGAPR